MHRWHSTSGLLRSPLNKILLQTGESTIIVELFFVYFMTICHLLRSSWVNWKGTGTAYLKTLFKDFSEESKTTEHTVRISPPPVQIRTQIYAIRSRSDRARMTTCRLGLQRVIILTTKHFNTKKNSHSVA